MNNTNSAPTPTPDPLAAALATAAGFPTEKDAAGEVKKYEMEEEKRQADRRKDQKDAHEKKLRWAQAMILLGLFLAHEILEGRCHPLLGKLPRNVLDVFLRVLGLPTGEASDTPALPFPCDETIREASGLAEAEKREVENLLRKIGSPIPEPHQGKPKEPAWKNPPTFITVDHTLLNAEECKEQADRLADRIDKRIKRLGVGTAIQAPVRSDDPLQIEQYISRINALSPDLGRSMTNLSFMLVSGHITLDVYLSCLRDVPVIPPDPVRILLRDVIRWRERA